MPEGEVHAYTNESAFRRQGRWCAGCDVWFGEESDFNINVILHGRIQTNNRAETTAIIKAVRRVMAWPTDLRRLVIFTDNQICADGVNKWMDLWEADG